MLKQNDSAPIFTALDQNGNTISLKDFEGEKVALYFYPKDNTPGCTAQACSLRDNFETLKQKGINVIGVSTDSQKRHKKFVDKFNLPFTILVDEDKKIVNDYGMWGEKKFLGKTYQGTIRNTFLINGHGLIDYIITKVDTKNHASQILETWGMK